MAKDRFPFPSRSQEESIEERDYSDSKIISLEQILGGKSVSCDAG